MQQRIKKQPFLELFDGADTNATIGERPVSTTPLQALFMMNDLFAHDQADKFAVRVALAFSEDTKRIDFAYRLALNRRPTREEIRQARSFMQRCRSALLEAKISDEQQTRAAWASFCRVLLSSNEFMFVD